MSKQEKKKASREDPDYINIQREIIGEMSSTLLMALESQHSLLTALQDAEHRLALYRQQKLEWLENAISNYKAGISCVPGCRKHVWDHATGWKRRKGD